MSEVRIEPTIYEGLYRHIAPDGYVFMCCNDCFGSVVYGGYKLENHYRLEKKG